MDSGFAVVDNDAIRESAQTVVDEAISHLKKLGYEAEGRVEAGDPTAILVQLSQEVDLIVVGTREAAGSLTGCWERHLRLCLPILAVQ